MLCENNLHLKAIHIDQVLKTYLVSLYVLEDASEDW